MGAERAARASDLGATVVAFADEDRDRANDLAAKYAPAISVTDVDGLPWPALDAVFICTPPSARDAAMRRAIESKVAVMVEKPIGLKASQGSDIAKAAHAAGVINAVGYMNRYRASVRRAKDLLAARTVAAVMCHWACRPYAVPWWRAEDKSGGPFNEQATHLVDLCRFIAGEIDDVAAYASGSGATMTRVAAALRFASGALGTLCYTCDAPDKFIAFEVVTTTGTIRLEGWNFALAANSIDGSTCAEDRSVFEIETQAFLRAVATKDQSLVASSFEDAARTQAVVDAVRAASIA
jgi:predicted dehydrogenase